MDGSPSDLWHQPSRRPVEELLEALTHLDVVGRGRLPTLSVLDTSCVHTGLQSQLLHSGRVPACIDAAREDKGVSVFMELDTLAETVRKLPMISEKIGASPRTLARLLNDTWLPWVRIVSVPATLRPLDNRAIEVRAKDEDDYPAAALASLLSPCIALTHNSKDFKPLGIRNWDQAKVAVGAAVDLRAGNTHFRAAAMVPAAPVIGIGSLVKGAADRWGPLAYLLFAALVVGGGVLYQRQPEERRAAIRDVAGGVGYFLLNEATEAAEKANVAGKLLSSSIVPAPIIRSSVSAVMRELAFSEVSLSAQQLYERMDPGSRRSAAWIRAFLHARKPDLFQEVRCGSFVLGHHRRINY